jgi:hypothetical protein
MLAAKKISAVETKRPKDHAARHGMVQMASGAVRLHLQVLE